MTVKADVSPVVALDSCSLYWPGEVCTAAARTPAPAALTALTTDCREPSVGVMLVVVPSFATSWKEPPVRVKVEGSLSEAVEDAVSSECAVASWLTVKVSEPPSAPAVAEAATEVSLEVADRAPQVALSCNVFAAESSAWNLVLRPW